MSKRRVVDLSQISGFDLDYRPHNYFWATDLKVPLPSSIAGETRRQMVRALLQWDAPIPDGLDAAVLNEAMLEAWGNMHPSHMGGEYLPPLRKREVEIARISLQSVTADQISIRARCSSKRIRYCIVDEYPDFASYVCHPTSSASPLSLRNLILLLETAREGSSIIIPILEMNRGSGSTLKELAAFVSVSSDFYPELGAYYRALIDAWIEEQTPT